MVKDSKTIPFAPLNLNIELSYQRSQSSQEVILLVMNQIAPWLMNDKFATQNIHPGCLDDYYLHSIVIETLGYSYFLLRDHIN